MSQYFSRTWEHFDVNNEQLVDALDMPAFEKYLMSDQGVDLDAIYAWANKYNNWQNIKPPFGQKANNRGQTEISNGLWKS